MRRRSRILTATTRPSASAYRVGAARPVRRTRRRPTPRRPVHRPRWLSERLVRVRSGALGAGIQDAPGIPVQQDHLHTGAHRSPAATGLASSRASPASRHMNTSRTATASASSSSMAFLCVREEQVEHRDLAQPNAWPALVEPAGVRRPGAAGPQVEQAAARTTVLRVLRFRWRVRSTIRSLPGRVDRGADVVPHVLIDAKVVTPSKRTRPRPPRAAAEVEVHTVSMSCPATGQPSISLLARICSIARRLAHRERRPRPATRSSCSTNDVAQPLGAGQRHSHTT